MEVADLFPRVTFVGTVALQADSFPGLTKPGADAYSFGPRISWAAFDLGRVRQRIKAADARTESSLATYEQTVLLALEETENSLVALPTKQQKQSMFASYLPHKNNLDAIIASTTVTSIEKPRPDCSRRGFYSPKWVRSDHIADVFAA